MERRKFTIGLGALATGSAAAVGSGAFDVVSARRDFTVEAVGDNAGAFLGFQPGSPDTNSPYASIDEETDTISIDFSNNRADGVNHNADTRFDDVFTITNNGTQAVSVKPVEELTGTARWSTDLPAIYYSIDGENPFQASNDFSAGEYPTLEPGESMVISFMFWAGPGDPIGRYESTDLDKAEDQDTIGFYVSAATAQS